MPEIRAEMVADLRGADTVVCCLKCGQIVAGFMAGDMAIAHEHPLVLPGSPRDRTICGGSGCTARLVPSGTLRASADSQIGLDCPDFPEECQFCALDVGGELDSQATSPPCLRSACLQFC